MVVGGRADSESAGSTAQLSNRHAPPHPCAAVQVTAVYASSSGTEREEEEEEGAAAGPVDPAALTSLAGARLGMRAWEGLPSGHAETVLLLLLSSMLIN